MAATQIILPRFVLPIRPVRTLLRDHAVVVENGQIAALAPADEILRDWPDALRIERSSHVLMPGLVNMHTHSPMALLRGFADDLSLESWLREHIWPAERHHVGKQFVSEGTELAMAEMIRGGTTCFNEMYFFPDALAESVREAGMRASIGLPVIEMETAWASGADECFAKAQSVHQELRDDPLLSASLAPHALYTVSDESLERLAALSADDDLPVYMHVLEIAWEIEHSRREYGISPLDRLAQHGLLGDRFMAVHMAHLSGEDIERLAATGTHVIHCPESNLKLASGICPIAELLAHGVNVSVGTDGAASNNDLDLLGELRTAALLAKGVTGDPTVLDAWQALDLVTINAARALGLHDAIGSIEPGKRADLCVLDLDHPRTQPVHHVESQLVYAAGSSQVSDVWVDGRQLLDRGALTTIDQERVLANASAWNDRLARANA